MHIIDVVVFKTTRCILFLEKCNTQSHWLSFTITNVGYYLFYIVFAKEMVEKGLGLRREAPEANQYK